MVRDCSAVDRKVLIARQLLVAMPGEVFVADFLGFALGMATWFTGTARSCAGGSSATNSWARL